MVLVSLARQYAEFLSRPLAAPRAQPVLSSYPSAWTHFSLLCLLFLALHRGLPAVLRRLWPQWWDSLPQRKRDEFPAYVTSLMHHLVAVPLAALTVWGDIRGEVDYAAPAAQYAALEALLLPWSTAYFAADSLCYALPQLLLRGQGDYLVHHVCTLWMAHALLSSSVNFSRYLTQMLLCDCTGVLFALAWILRSTTSSAGAQHTHTVVKALEIAFAVMFFVLRAVHGAAVFLTVFFHPLSAELGVVRLTLPVIAAMQWLWMSKIFLGLAERLGMRTTKRLSSKSE